MIQRSLGVLVALLLLSAGSASADIFPFAYASVNGSSVSASGIITATLLSPGKYQITDVTGYRNGQPITFIPNPGFSSVDNELLVPAAPAFLSSTGSSGFAIETVDGEFNPWYDYNGAFGGVTGDYYEYNGGSIPGTLITFNVPEPGVMSILVAMFVGLTCMTSLVGRKAV